MRFAARLFGGALDVERLAGVFENSGIERRQLCKPLAWFAQERGFGEKNDVFLAAAERLAASAVQQVLADHDLAPADIDHLVFVTSTGLATPTIDARLLGRLGFRPGTLRTPLFGLGCAGGALGLIHATELLRGRPRHKLLLVNVELCALTFQHDDRSKSNFVATALFGDGVTAALLVGGAHDGVMNEGYGGLEVCHAATHLWPDTLDVMGWNFVNHGMQVVFSARIPELVRREMPGCLEAFLAAADVTQDAVDHWAVHPGGAKVLAAYESALGLDAAQLARSRRVLAEHGNCSAVTVMLVLEDLLRSGALRHGDRVLTTALGPGFSAGTLLWQRV